MGGSYDYDTGTIRLKVRRDGSSSRSIDEGLIHEMVHLGIEESIVRKYELTAPEKEAMVDQICQLWLGDLLPTYRRQRIADVGMVRVVTKGVLLHDPRSVVQQFVRGRSELRST